MNEARISLAGKISDSLKRLIAGKLGSQYKGEAPYSGCRVQEGYFDFLGVECRGSRIRLYLYDFGADSFRADAPEIDELEREEFEAIVPLIAKSVEEEFLAEANLPFFAYKLDLAVKFEGASESLAQRSCEHKFYFENAARKAELKRKMDDYIDELIIRRDKKIKDGREIFVLMDRIFDLSLMDYDEAALASLLERVIAAVQDVKNRQLLGDFIIALENNLRRWKEEKFLPKFYDISDDGWSKDYELKKDFMRQNVDAGELTFFVRTALWNIKFKRYSWDVDLARKDLECAAKIFGSAQAQSYLDHGTGELEGGLVKFKDADVECSANDVFAQVRVKIKNETASAYKKALNFIVKLLQAGFAASYAVKLSSKAQKVYLPIKGLAPTQTHRFFAAALAHGLDEELELYANEALKHKFEFYADTDGEKCLMSGSYAVFGLALKSEKYFGLARRYFETVDAEHQSAHIKFIEAFIDRYGISERSLEVIVAGLLSYQEDKIYKSLKALMKGPANKALFAHAISGLSEYEKESAAYAVWGKDWQKNLKG